MDIVPLTSCVAFLQKILEVMSSSTFVDGALNVMGKACENSAVLIMLNSSLFAAVRLEAYYL